MVLLALAGTALWWLSRSSEPSYNGKSLTQWLDDYNQAPNLELTAPASEAIRAMGTNCLPYLLAHVRHHDSAFRDKLMRMLGKQRFISLPFSPGYPYSSASVLALYALGGRAAPIFPDLLRLSENPDTCYVGGMCLLATGTNGLPTLAIVCRSTNVVVRVQAALMIALMRSMGSPWFSWGWDNTPPFKRRTFTIGYAVGDQPCREFIRMLDDSDPAIRRAGADAINVYVRASSATAKDAIQPLAAATKDADPEVRQSAKDALIKLDPGDKAGVRK